MRDGCVPPFPEAHTTTYFLLLAAPFTGARLFNTTSITTNPFIKVWYAVDSSGEARVALLHKDMNATANATYVRHGVEVTCTRCPGCVGPLKSS